MRQPSDTETAAGPSSLDVVFDVLSNSYRRRVLTAISDANPDDESEFTLEGLAPDDEPLEELRPILYHSHLPKLAENGYIEWDPDTETVRRGRNFDEIAPLVSLLAEHRDELPVD